MERNILLAKNPWWKGKEHFREDEDYIRWEEKKVRWVPKEVEEICMEPFSLHFVLGPRQVGKTTLIKLIIKSLLEKCRAEQIFYFRCDELKDYKELDELLTAYFTLREEFEIDSSYIFLDEITFAEEWFRTIKSWIDEGKFKNDVLVISGSTSFEIQKQAEYFPGRRGKGKDFLILPLSFREFIKIMNPKIHQKLPKISSFEDIMVKASKSFLFFDELNSLLKLYFKIGGFPLSINSYEQNKKIEEPVKQTYLNWIKSDIAKANRNINSGREILKATINKIPTPISWEKIAKETSIKSPKTVNAYLHMFEEMFLISISYYLDLNNLTIEFGKNKKIHLMDPLFYELFEEWCLIEIKDKDNKKAEDILASHLLKFGKSSKLFSDAVFYWKNGFEVDSIIRTKNKAIGFEAKWSKDIKPIKRIVGKLKEVYLISQEIFNSSQKIIPLSVFLSLLDV